MGPWIFACHCPPGDRPGCVPCGTKASNGRPCWPWWRWNPFRKHTPGLGSQTGHGKEQHSQTIHGGASPVGCSCSAARGGQTNMA
eukprot:4144599-Lingulodinium_polyedra.AAC.1